MNNDTNAAANTQSATPTTTTTTGKVAPRFSYVAYDFTAAAKQKTFRDAFEALEQTVETTLVAGRAKALVLTALEEAYMWVGKSIRDEQVARTGAVDEAPARGNT